MTTISLPRFLLCALMLSLGALLARLHVTDRLHADEAATQLPEGFVEEVGVSQFDTPVDVEFLPTGDMLVAETGIGPGTEAVAHVRLVRDGELQELPVLTLSTNTYGDSGVQGLILDPDFASNGYFYVWYSTGENAMGWNGTSVNRLSRFTFDEQTETADPDSELILLDGIHFTGFHNGGGLAFDSDGNLYVATGDAFEYDLAQDLTSLNGKILRIRPTDTGYVVPTDNPFTGIRGVRPEIYAYGLRNPFRMTRHDETGRIVVGDVGQSTWEEINEVIAGANFGWPIREGPCPIGEREPCEPAPADFTDPLLYYPHPDDPNQGAAVTGLAFYEGDRFPDAYHDTLFFVDFNQRFMAVPDQDTTQVSWEQHDLLTTMDHPMLTHFADEVGFVVDVEYYQDAIYAVEIVQGHVSRFAYAGPENEVPTAHLSVTPTLGSAPLEVVFSAEGSTEPDGTALTYHWNFGDGSDPVTTTDPIENHTYTEDGNYLAELEVSATNGTSDTTTVDVTVYSGEIPSIEFTNLTDSTRALYYGGDEIRYEAIRESGTDDLDAETPYTWRIDLHHNQHAHPVISGHTTVQDTFEISTENHGNSSNLWYRFYLTMHAVTDSGKDVSVTVSRELLPAKSEITIAAAFDPVQVVVDRIRRTTPYPFTSIVGVEHSATTPENLIRNGNVYTFSHWSGQSEGSPTLNIYAPQNDTTYVAQYDYLRPADQSYLPFTFK